MHKDIIIIGGGLTGLSIAYHLRKKQQNVLILEKSEETGGVIQTGKENGFVYEMGPNTGVLSHPEAAELFEELGNSCELERANPEAKKRLIWKNNAWHALPSGLMEAVTTPLFSLKDKFRMLGEPFRKKGNDPFESVAGLVIRRLGKSYLDYAVDPFISGIYAGDPSYLVTRYALPKLYNLEQTYGSFIKGAIRKKTEKQEERMAKATREVFSAKDGLGNMIQALENAIGLENIQTHALNAVITPLAKEGFKVSTMVYDHKVEYTSKVVISTVGAYALPGLLPFITEPELSPVTCLEYAKVIQVILGFNHWDGMPLNAFGGLVPSKENRKILGALFTSSFLGNRAPETGALLSVFLGGIKKPELFAQNNEQISSLVLNEITEMLHLKKCEPDLLRIFRYEKAIPQYGRNSKERLEAITKLQKKYPGLILAGNIRDGIGMADRIKQAKTIADEVLEKM